jgi:type IV secretion system protein VirB6
MTSRACQQALDNVAGGVGASLRAVDCAAAEMAQGAFGRLFGAQGALTPALTILLTLFIAVFALGLITGRMRISLSSLTPRMFTLVAVVTFATSWLAFQAVFYNLAVGAPDEIARALMGTRGSATSVFADKIDIVLGALVEASAGNAMADATSVFSPPGLMWLGGTLLLLGTVGVLATSKIALAVLMALGPVFIVLALFDGTRGLFVGWLKGLVMLAIAPLFAVLGGSLMLELAVPVIAALTSVPGRIDARAAMAFFMIGAVHVALMVMVIKVAATMVGGWTVFGLARSGGSEDAGRSAASAAPAAAPLSAPAPRTDVARTTSPAPARQIRVAGFAGTAIAANDTNGGEGGALARTTRIVTGATAPSSPETERVQVSRARGIGSRFRTPARPAPQPSATRSVETK